MTRPVESDLIYDVGAHRGEDSEFYLKLGYRVVAVEANPELANHLRNRFAQQIEQGRYALVEKAVAAEPGTITFFVNKEKSDWGTVDPRWAERNRHLGADSVEIAVEAMPFDAILREHGVPHYMKIDVEGVDMLCVKALASFENGPDFLSLESEKRSWSGLLAEFDEMTRLGYTRFKVVDQRKHRPGQFAAVDGSLVEHRFVYGATGPFGQAASGPWLSRKEAIAKYRRVFMLYALVGDEAPLKRFIARIPLLRRALRQVSWYDTHAAR
jgi:FkbM family methyltransferase